MILGIDGFYCINSVNISLHHANSSGSVGFDTLVYVVQFEMCRLNFRAQNLQRLIRAFQKYLLDHIYCVHKYVWSGFCNNGRILLLNQPLYRDVAYIAIRMSIIKRSH